MTKNNQIIAILHCAQRQLLIVVVEQRLRDLQSDEIWGRNSISERTLIKDEHHSSFVLDDSSVDDTAKFGGR